MTDRELLEAAAKAAGIEISGWNFGGSAKLCTIATGGDWNPLTDDGDALRLAVKLGISVMVFSASISTRWPQCNLPSKLIGTEPPHEDISSGQDPYAATRRAIVRAAAEIGKEKT